MQLHDYLQTKQTPPAWEQPLFFNLQEEADRTRLEALFESGTVRSVLDEIDLAIAELFDIHNPSLKDTKTDEQVASFAHSLTGGATDTYGNWVYFPWSGDLVHFPPEADYRLLRTARNRNLITQDEQQELAKGSVLIVGLSVGSNAVEMLLSESIGGTYILVDMDIIEPTNLNRIKLAYQQVGVHKVDAVAKRVSEIDPYVRQVHYREGLNEENLAEIFATHQPDLIIDEMDDLSMKIKLRQAAANHKKAVLMATDDGENAILDIERYDENDGQQMFEGRLSDEILDKVLNGELSRPEIGMIIGKHFVGADLVPLRMFESLREVGKTLPSWPQLAGAATLSGVSLAYAAKKILLQQPLKPGRHMFDLDAELDPMLEDEAHQQQLAQYRQMFSK
ncbi:MAG TPA: ThiF family adenylyltransferase [Candidatus Saccharimonadales bacterium]